MDWNQELGGDTGQLIGIVCDVNMHPRQLHRLLGPPLKRLAPGGILIVTLKFGGKGYLSDKCIATKQAVAMEVLATLSILLGRPWRSSNVAWLCANTEHERVIVAVAG